MNPTIVTAQPDYDHINHVASMLAETDDVHEARQYGSALATLCPPGSPPNHPPLLQSVVLSLAHWRLIELRYWFGQWHACSLPAPAAYFELDVYGSTPAGASQESHPASGSAGPIDEQSPVIAARLDALNHLLDATLQKRSIAPANAEWHQLSFGELQGRCRAAGVPEREVVMAVDKEDLMSMMADARIQSIVETEVPEYQWLNQAEAETVATSWCSRRHLVSALHRWNSWLHSKALEHQTLLAAVSVSQRELLLSSWFRWRLCSEKAALEEYKVVCVGCWRLQMAFQTWLERARGGRSRTPRTPRTPR